MPYVGPFSMLPKPKYMRVANALLFLSCLILGGSFLPVVSAEKDYYFRFTSDGSGFRSLCMHMGYMNLFKQAGLINATGSRFASISFSSSGSWFATQFYWSPQFFNGTALAETPDDLYDFANNWAKSYENTYNAIQDLFQRGAESIVARVVKEHEVSLYLAVEGILSIASRDYGDPGLMKRFANFDNRVSALNKTDLYLANGLHPNMRYIGAFGKYQDSITYVGPADSDNVYAVPFAYQYAVKDDRIMWYAGVEDNDLPLKTCVSRSVPAFFHFEDWADFNLYPENAVDGTNLVPKSKIPPCEVEGYLTEPWGGGVPTVTQAALTGSTLGTEITSRAPSSFAQANSVQRNNLLSGIPGFLSGVGEKAMVAALQVVWKLFDNKVNLGVCTQTGGCGINDGFFTHSGVLDAASLPMTIGQHHSIDNADRSKTLKIIHSVNTLVNNGSFLQFFSTLSNVGVPPGGYHWPPQAAGGPATSPYPSFQVFESYLDQEMFDAMLTTVDGTYVRTVRMSNLTTVANPRLHVEAGQKVDLLVLAINEDLPLGPIPLFSLGADFAEAARKTAASAELLQIIIDFASN